MTFSVIGNPTEVSQLLNTWSQGGVKLTFGLEAIAIIAQHINHFGEYDVSSQSVIYFSLYL